MTHGACVNFLGSVYRIIVLHESAGSVYRIIVLHEPVNVSFVFHWQYKKTFNGILFDATHLNFCFIITHKARAKGNTLIRVS